MRSPVLGALGAAGCLRAAALRQKRPYNERCFAAKNFSERLACTLPSRLQPPANGLRSWTRARNSQITLGLPRPLPRKARKHLLHDATDREFRKALASRRQGQAHQVARSPHSRATEARTRYQPPARRSHRIQSAASTGQGRSHATCHSGCLRHSTAVNSRWIAPSPCSDEISDGDIHRLTIIRAKARRSPPCIRKRQPGTQLIYVQAKLE